MTTTRRKAAVVTRGDLERARTDLSRELKTLDRSQRNEYLKAAGQVYNGLARMAKIRSEKV